MDQVNCTASKHRGPWNKGKLVGQKAPLRVKEIWSIRIRLQLADRTRELALFNLAVDSTLRSCDLAKLGVRDVTHGERVAARVIVMQQKTQRPVQFEINEQTGTHSALGSADEVSGRKSCCFPADFASPHLSTRQYARVVRCWVKEIRLDPAAYGTHTLRRTKASLTSGGPRTFGLFSFFSGIPSWRAPLVIWESRSTTLLRWPNRRKSRSRSGRRLQWRSLTGHNRKSPPPD
jgi:hypothetical protein